MSRVPRIPLVRSRWLRHSSGFARMQAAVEQDYADTRRWMRRYCRGVRLVLKIPGGRDYQYDRRSHMRFVRYIWDPNPAVASAILAQALTQLGRPRLIDELPRFRKLAKTPLPRDVRYRLRHGGKARTLAVAIDCIDRLLIAPVMPGWERFHEP